MNDTTILVVGKANTNLFQEDPRSLKMQKVEALQQGANIRGYS
jgi:DNA polymerase-3 subunit epsilon